MSVTAAKPAVGGAIKMAPLGTTLPTTADGTPATAFAQLGYVSDSGLTRAIETFAFALLDAHSVEVLKLVNGDSNVTGTALASGITVNSNNKDQPGHAFVIDMLEAGNTLHRIVIPNGILTSLENITYVDTGAEAYGVTITAVADSAGNTCYEYFKTAAST